MESQAPLAPDFIQFLFSSKPKFDCFFEVGNKSQGKPERIGAVKLMLMAHSEVFRPMLEDSELKEKGDVPVKDVHPDTFKGMLKYVYGHNTTSDMCFDEADDLLYVAEKYRIKTLKDKLAVRLMKLLNPDNICSLLNNPACYRHLELDSAITKILRHETDHILASPQFVLMNADIFLKILEQDGLAVPEIELFRAAIKWAKHRANSEDGQVLRQQLTQRGLTQHLRPYTLTANAVFEVIPSGILTTDEIISFSLYQRNNENIQHLSDFSNETQPRKRLYSEVLNEVTVTKNTGCVDSVENYGFTILTKQHCIELLPLVCQSTPQEYWNPKSWTYKVECTTTITKVPNEYNPSSSANEPPITMSFSEDVRCGVEFEIPLTVDGRNVILLPDTKYTVNITVKGGHQRYTQDSGLPENDHLRLYLQAVWCALSCNYYFPSNTIKYRATSPH